MRKAHENKIRIGFKGLDFVKQMPLDREIEPEPYQNKEESYPCQEFDPSEVTNPLDPSMDKGLHHS